MKLQICIDVDDVDRAIKFYGEGLGLTVVEHHPDWAHVKLDEQTFWLMKIPEGADGTIARDYRRHWTPVHLDFLVEDIDLTVERALKAGGKLDREVQVNRDGGKLANLCDPSGNGIDLVQRPEK